jgi:hypothetical protein
MLNGRIKGRSNNSFNASGISLDVIENLDASLNSPRRVNSGVRRGNFCSRAVGLRNERKDHIIIGLSLLLIMWSVSFASSEARKFLVYGTDEANCETEMAHLDNYTIALLNEPNTKAYVIAYGGQRGMARSEMQVRRTRIKRYLVNNRGIAPKRITVVDGGFRESLSIELWLVPSGAAIPKVEPTISHKDVKYGKAKYNFDCSTFY